PVAVLHLGQRVPTVEELARETVACTVLFPGERVVLPAAAPPVLEILPLPYYDPVAGKRPPEEECLHDGGDRGQKAGLDAQGQLPGLDPEDTVAEWTDAKGRRHVTCSNRVCLCVPRFGVYRCVLPLREAEAIVEAGAARKVVRQVLVEDRLPSRLAL